MRRKQQKKPNMIKKMNQSWIVIPTGVVEDLVPRADNIFTKAAVMSPCLPLPLVKVAVLTRTPCIQNNNTKQQYITTTRNNITMAVFTCGR